MEDRFETEAHEQTLVCEVARNIRFIGPLPVHDIVENVVAE